MRPLRGWPLFGHPLSRFGVGAPKPGVKVPEFTSGTGRGQSPIAVSHFLNSI